MAFVLDIDPVIVRLPLVGIPLTWYGLIFAFAFYCSFFLFKKRLFRYLAFNEISDVRNIDVYVDKLLAYLIFATIVGARLGHILFYENLFKYIEHPISIFKTWEGGLASHGGIIAIVLAMLIFVKRAGKRLLPDIGFLRLLDLVAGPTLLVGFSIRIGNFINQEIIGPPTSLFWGVVFMQPSDPVEIVARHPTQLYEALFYLCTFFVCKYLFFKKFFIRGEGRLAGLVLFLAFSIRLFLEPLKYEHSFYMLSSSSIFRMGQFLSLPFMLIGLVLIFRQTLVAFLHRQLGGESEP